MAPKWRFIILAVLFALPLVIAFSSRDGVSSPDAVQLVCQVDSVLTPLNNNHIVIPVYVTNISDSISGFELWVNTAYPEFIKFSYDSIHSGSIFAKFDTVGCRTKGWKFFTARILDPLHGLVKVTGLCDPDSPRVVKPIPPGSGLLVKLIAETNGALGDSLCDSISVGILINRTETRFSNSANPPAIIGCVYAPVTETSYTNCAHMIGDSCTSWFDTNIVTRIRCVSIDTTARILIDGKAAFNCCQCGDADGSGGTPDISDAVYLIAYIFGGGPAPGPCQGNPRGLGDADGSGGTPDISDAVYLIAYIFGGGPTPHCP